MPRVSVIGKIASTNRRSTCRRHKDLEKLPGTWTSLQWETQLSKLQTIKRIATFMKKSTRRLKVRTYQSPSPASNRPRLARMRITPSAIRWITCLVRLESWHWGIACRLYKRRRPLCCKTVSWGLRLIKMANQIGMQGVALMCGIQPWPVPCTVKSNMFPYCLTSHRKLLNG